MPRPDFGYHTVAETAIDKRDMTAGQVRQSFLLCCHGLYQYTRPADYPARFPTDRAIMEFLVQYGAEDADGDGPLSPLLPAWLCPGVDISRSSRSGLFRRPHAYLCFIPQFCGGRVV